MTRWWLLSGALASALVCPVSVFRCMGWVAPQVFHQRTHDSQVLMVNIDTAWDYGYFFCPVLWRKIGDIGGKGPISQGFCPRVCKLSHISKGVMLLGLLWRNWSTDLGRRIRPSIAISMFMSSSHTIYIHPWGKIRFLNIGLLFFFSNL